ncbi:MAG: hypothetical protein SGARI_000482 [Bacillariaceae sp.]
MTDAQDFRNKFFKAALAGDTAALESTINHQVEKHNASPAQMFTELYDGKKRSASHLMCQAPKGDDEEEDILEFALNKTEWFPDHGEAALKSKDTNGLTPLMIAAQAPDPFLAQCRVLFLLSKDPKLGLARSKAGATALHYAAAAGATPATIMALHESAKAAIQTFASKGGTPLHWALIRDVNEHQNLEGESPTSTVDALLECGADINAHQWKDAGDHTTKNYSVPPPIMMAITAKSDTFCNRLLQSNDIDTSLPFPGDNNLLHLLAASNLSVSLKTLLGKMTDEDKQQALTKTNGDTLTPLEAAAKEGTVECVRLLLGATNATDPTKDEATAFIDAWKAEAKENQKMQPPQLPEPTNAFEAEEQPKVIAILNQADASPENVQRANDLKVTGNTFFSNKQWDAACTFYTQAIDCNPKEASVYSNRSMCHMKLERPMDALADGIMARNLKPDWSKACYRVAVAWLALKRYEESAMAAFTGLEMDPENKELQKLLEKCVSQGKEAAKASKPPPQQPAMDDPNDPRVIDRLVRRRYKELRAEGNSTEVAMRQAREELMPSADEEVDAAACVAAMFGIH